MPHRGMDIIKGEITGAFARRIAVRAAEGPVPADLGPKPAGDAEPGIGGEVRVAPKRKRSERGVAAPERGGMTFEADLRDGREHGGGDPAATTRKPLAPAAA